MPCQPYVVVPEDHLRGKARLEQMSEEAEDRGPERWREPHDRVLHVTREHDRASPHRPGRIDHELGETIGGRFGRATGTFPAPAEPEVEVGRDEHRSGSALGLDREEGEVRQRTESTVHASRSDVAG